ncbi:cytochrome P450 [Actinomadura verrucosospora]|uniref:Cytochrome P450-pinF2, plant-inducible n=1 Tax=Actinomadura verrucosospora TaxID=46165 RepID=A0A7D3ZCU3_ACTVE|nr:cytochrome P450 [Actinomadura verrucosospora]QKG19337.1 cytochrome P450-pinF2, plant-inducible [Actinomadura verrucosospora]
MTSDPTSRFPIGAAATVAELEDDPHPLLARLRAAEPVSWLPALGGWLVTSRDLAQRVMRDAAAFTVDDPRFSTARVVGPSMLSLDGPVHTRHRDPFARPFRPARTRERFTAFVEAEVARLVGGLALAGRAELRGELAGPLAVAVVAEALGLEGVDAATIRSWYGAFVDAVSAITAGGDAPARADEAYALLRAAVEKAITADAPGSLLAEAAADEAGLTTAEVVANAAILMFGGIDTTEGMIANTVLHLLGHPGQLRLVLDDPGLLPAAIEESLRLEPSASVVDRYATRDTVLGDVTVRAGDLVRVSIAGANRDPAVFPDPDRFDVRRANAGEHLAFAHGPHFCFGAHLARLEACTAVTALLELPGLRLDPSAAPRAHGLVFRKPPHLHVLWDR